MVGGMLGMSQKPAILKTTIFKITSFKNTEEPYLSALSALEPFPFLPAALS